MVGGLVQERMGRQNAVATNVAASYAEPQRIAGPVLVVPYTEEYTVQDKRLTLRSTLYILPKEIDASGKINTDVKRRGLFRVPVYTLDSNWKGHFEIPADLNTRATAARPG